MKNKLIFVVILILIFGGFVLFRFFFLEKQNNFGRIKVLASPVASVFINNEVVGKTPFEGKYKVGEYLLKLIPEGEATQTASWQGKVKINKNALTYVNRELGSSDVLSAGEVFAVARTDKSQLSKDNGEVSIETEPSGAIVYLDNDEKGVAPLILSEVIKGDHELSVFMPGFFRRNQKIKIDPGYRVTASFKLSLDQAQQKQLEEQNQKEASNSASTTASTTENKKETVLIKDTPTGWLRVREDATVTASEAARVKPGEKYPLLEEKDSWYKIEYEKGKTGWISSEYADKQ